MIPINSVYNGNNNAEKINIPVCHITKPAFVDRAEWMSFLGYSFPPQLNEIYTNVVTDKISCS